LLLVGGDKVRQQKDIDHAIAMKIYMKEEGYL
jgi:putative component of toxin-antitoxin plasmid stabilization module